MSLCLNSRCHQPNHPGNSSAVFCQACGTTLTLQGRYRVMRLLSDRSGFGRVYEAYEQNCPKLLKVLKASFNETPKALELFEKEAMVLSQLHHPGIPRIEPDGYFQVSVKGLDYPLHCIVMEKIEGLNLRQWMQQQGSHPIGEAQALQWIQQLVEVLHLIHHKNYFHRDIKPENIMLRETGQLVLVDFGAARQITETYLAQIGQSGGITALSSAGYTPPEQEQGQAVPQSDFYALGRTFVYLLTTKHPTDQTIYDPFSNEFVWRSFAAHISPPLAQLLDDMIAPRAIDRPKNTAEILNRLHQIRAGLSASDLQTPTQVEATLELDPLSPSPTREDRARPSSQTAWQGGRTQNIEERKTLRLRRWWLGGAGCAGLIAIAAVIGWYFSDRAPLPAAEETPQHQAQKSVLLVRTLSGHTSSVNAIALIPGVNQLVSGSADTTIKQWNLTTGGEIRTLTGHTSFINALALSPSGQILASGSADKTIRLWDLTTGDLLGVLTGHVSSVNALAISHSGQRLISGSADGTIKIWALDTYQELASFQAHPSAINALAVSSDDSFFVTGSADRTLALWNLDTGTERSSLRGHDSYINTLTTTPDGQYLISGSADTTIKIWNFQDSSPNSVETLTGHSSFVNDLVITPDGQTLMSAGTDEVVKFWDLPSGQLRYTVTGFDSYIDQLIRLPNDQLITARREDSTIRVWVVQ